MLSATDPPIPILANTQHRWPTPRVTTFHKKLIGNASPILKQNVNKFQPMQMRPHHHQQKQKRHNAQPTLIIDYIDRIPPTSSTHHHHNHHKECLKGSQHRLICLCWPTLSSSCRFIGLTQLFRSRYVACVHTSIMQLTFTHSHTLRHHAGGAALTTDQHLISSEGFSSCLLASVICTSKYLIRRLFVISAHRSSVVVLVVVQVKHKQAQEWWTMSIHSFTVGSAESSLSRSLSEVLFLGWSGGLMNVGGAQKKRLFKLLPWQRVKERSRRRLRWGEWEKRNNKSASGSYITLLRFQVQPFHEWTAIHWHSIISVGIHG